MAAIGQITQATRVAKSEAPVVPAPGASLAANHAVAAQSGRSGGLVMAPHRAAEITRFNEGFQPLLYSADAAAAYNWQLAIARMRWLVSNDPDISSCARVFSDHVVGSGINVWATMRLGDSADKLRLNTPFNLRANEEWEQWQEEECDFEGWRSFADIQRIVVNELMSAGEAFLIEEWNTDRSRRSPLCYRLAEAEQLDESQDTAGATDDRGHRIYRGIEYDANWRPVAYYFFVEHPYGAQADRASVERVEASRVIHFFVPTRCSQRRGWPWLAACVLSAHDRDWLMGNVLTAAAVQAIFTVIQKTAKAGGNDALDARVDDDPETPRLGRGVVIQASPTDEFQALNPTQPGQALDKFLTAVQRQESQGAGISLLRLTRDYSGVNYSSARGAGEDDEMTFRPLRSMFARLLVGRVRNRHLDIGVALGVYPMVPAREYFANPREWRRARFQFPSRRSLDPDKESRGARTRMEDGITTLQMECDAVHGRPAEQVIMEGSWEKELAENHGVHIASMGPYPSGSTAAAADGSDSVDQEDGSSAED